MGTARPYLRYVTVFTVATAAVLLPVLALNYSLGLRSLEGRAAVLQASAWQQATGGVTYAPPLSDTRPFKSARLFDRLNEINTIVFGSSTAMGITQSMFADDMRIYNFSQTGNALTTVIAEAEFLQRRHPGIKWFVIPLDWAIGSLYEPGTPGQETLARPTAGDGSGQPAISLVQQLQDALSLPRVRNLLGILRGIARAPSPATAFRQVFLQDASDDYRCADGTPARDYDTIFRGTCTGFRYDGSATFGNLEPVPERRAQILIASAVVASSKYAMALAKSGGVPNPVFLERIGELARNLQGRGGGAILIMPPLLPGLERALLSAPHTSAFLRRTKDTLNEWARAQHLIIIDAGQAERFGCTAPEFVDEHHASPQCYARIFARYWRDLNTPGKINAGLYHGE
jgi:hypothetical protein